MRLSLTLRLFTLFVLAAVLCSAPLFAQGVTSAALNGRVTDSKGEALAGSNIVVVHNPSGTTYGTTSREDGRYNVPNLRVGGPYTVKVSYVGYRTMTRDNVFVELSQSSRLDFSLTEEALETGVVEVVSRGNPLINESRTGPAVTVTREELNRLPSISRSFADYYKLSPNFVGENAAGRNRSYNNIQIDGANYNDLFGLGGTTPGSQSRAVPISLDAIEQFQLAVSPFDVRQGGFTGAGINAVTRSGGNTFSGSAFYYGRNESFVGTSPDTLKKKLATFTDYQAGFRVGGPIIQNELFFFVNGEITRYKEPLTRIFGASAAGTNQFTAPLDSIRAVENILKNQYGYEPGSFETMDNEQTSDKVFVRLDWNLSEEHKLTLRHNYLFASLDNSPSRGRGQTDIYSANTRYVVENTTNSTALNLTSVLGNDMSNELIVGYTTQYDRPTFKGTAFPAIYVTIRNAAGQQNRLLSGAEQFRHRNELDQKILEITDNFTYYMGEHTLTAGARMEYFTFRNLFIPNNFGTYTFNTIYDLQIGRVSAYEYQYALQTSLNPNSSQNYAIEWNAVTYGGYIQDEWMVMPGLKLTGGIRVDIPTYPVTPAYNKKVDSTFVPLGYDISTDKVPDATPVISPRLAFNWDVFGDRTTQLRGGLGYFSGRVPYVWLSNQYGNTGVEYARIAATIATANQTAGWFNPDPYSPRPAGYAGLAPGTTYEIDITNPDFKGPAVWRASLGFDQELPEYFVATVEGLYSSSVNEILYQNINFKPNTGNTNGGLTPNGTLSGEGREVWGTYNAATRRWSTQVYNSTFTGVLYLKNTDKGDAGSITFQLQRPNAPDGFYFNGAYTVGYSKDINSGLSAQAFSGWRFNPVSGNPNDPPISYSAFDRRHKIIAVASYRIDWGADFGLEGLATTVGLSYTGLSGRGFSYYVNGDVNGDGLSDNDLFYVPKDQSDIILVTSTGAAAAQSAYDELFTFIDGDEYLKEMKGKMSERMGAREPWSHQLDFRLTQEVPTIMGQKFEFTFDILNVLNLLNHDWGYVKEVANQNVPIVNFYGLQSDNTQPNYGKPMYTWAPLKDPRIPDNIRSRWQMQFGVRYTF